MFIVHDVELFRINFGENVKGCLWFYGTDSWDVCQRFVNKFTLFINSSTWHNIIFYALVTAKCRLYDGLAWNIGAETHIREHV